VDVPGTRKDVGVSSVDRDPDFGPAGAGVTGGDDGAASTSEAAGDTSVESAGETDRTGPLHPPD
jgi:hypothetical protein